MSMIWRKSALRLANLAIRSSSKSTSVVHCSQVFSQITLLKQIRSLSYAWTSSSSCCSQLNSSNNSITVPLKSHTNCHLRVPSRFLGTTQTRLNPKIRLDPVETVREKVLEICQKHEKVESNKLEMNTNLINDLGLDSLDHIEIIMGVEDEFGFEIPDVESEKLLTPADIVKYVADKQIAANQ